MVLVAWPNPIPGQPDQVVVDDIPMEMVPGKYSVEEADRFGEKVSQGTLKYADFNPYESAHAVAALTGGAGLRRYSDAGDDPSQFATLYTESSNVNCCFSPVVLSPEVTYEPIPGATGPLVWMGDDLRLQNAAVVRRFLGIGPSTSGTGIWQRDTTGPWTQLLEIVGKGPPLGEACGLFDGNLIIGFGATATAVWVDPTNAVHDVTQAASEPTGVKPLFVWAYTSDHAANYIAGGTLNSDYFRVMSSILIGSSYSGAVSTGDSQISALAPGGGLVLVFVGKVDELGMIDPQAVYHTLVPFDSHLMTNCRPLRWLRASGTDAARGTMALVFPRERGLWEYAPSDIYSGTVSDIAPWSQTYRRPPNARGIVTAIQGSSRWLYYAVQAGDGHTWIYRNDQTTGSPHTYLDLGFVTCRHLAITYLFPGNPLMLFSCDETVGQVVLPLDGDMELDDPNCRFQLQGYVDIPDIDLGFPDEDKIGFAVRVISDNLVGLNRYHDVQYSADGGPWSALGNILASPSDEVEFPLGTKVKRLKLRIWFFTDDNTQSPEMWGFSVRLSLNTKVYRLFVFQTRLPAGSFSTLADDLQNPYITISHMWGVRRAGTPVPFADPWNDRFQARLIKFQEQQALREPDRTPEWVLDFTLLEYLPLDQLPTGVTDFVYDMDWTANPSSNPDQAALYGYDMPLAIYDSATPQ
ncbi:MAG TPA: hypothetical protein VLL82_13545 [Mycobacterium sp.]|nr:hypothetical protein [Mycobacterium sp.]